MSRRFENWCVETIQGGTDLSWGFWLHQPWAVLRKKQRGELCFRNLGRKTWHELLELCQSVGLTPVWKDDFWRSVVASPHGVLYAPRDWFCCPWITEDVGLIPAPEKSWTASREASGHWLRASRYRLRQEGLAAVCCKEVAVLFDGGLSWRALSEMDNQQAQRVAHTIACNHYDGVDDQGRASRWGWRRAITESMRDVAKVLGWMEAEPTWAYDKLYIPADVQDED